MFKTQTNCNPWNRQYSSVFSKCPLNYFSWPQTHQTTAKKSSFNDQKVMRCTDLCDDEYNASPRALAGGKFSAGKTLAALTPSFFTFRPYHLGRGTPHALLRHFWDSRALNPLLSWPLRDQGSKKLQRYVSVVHVFIYFCCALCNLMLCCLVETHGNSFTKSVCRRADRSGLRFVRRSPISGVRCCFKWY